MIIHHRQRALVIYREADRVLPYKEALVAAGVEPVLQAAEGAVTLDGFAGLILTGGTDVDPALYGEALGEHSDPPDRERDRMEYELLREALLLDLPVLGICRGMQLINVFHGGTLHQHLEPVERHRVITDPRSEAVHTVSIEHDSLLGRIAQNDTWSVNSRHHQGVAELGKGLRVSARDPRDGMIEAIERPDRSFVVAVQWHPEDQVFQFPEQLSLFAHFREACSAVNHFSRVETHR